MEDLMIWLTELNKNNHIGFGMLTVITMAGIGIFIAGITNLFFKAFGIKFKKIEIPD